MEGFRTPSDVHVLPHRGREAGERNFWGWNVKQLRTDQKSWILKDTSLAEVVGECDSLFHVGEIFGRGLVDACEKLECCD
jgi:hypothetical protein